MVSPKRSPRYFTLLSEGCRRKAEVEFKGASCHASYERTFSEVRGTRGTIKEGARVPRAIRETTQRDAAELERRVSLEAPGPVFVHRSPHSAGGLLWTACRGQSAGRM